MGIGGAAADDDDAELMLRVADTELLAAPPRALLGSFAPMAAAVCAAPHAHPPGLQTAAALALCKFMCVSVTFCEAHLPLLFTLLQASRVPGTRANIMVALGDLAARFPNVLEPWTPHLYGRLRDAVKH